MTTRTLHVSTSHDGDTTSVPLVLLHGFPFDSRMWDDVVRARAGRRTVMTVDLPGLGRSALDETVAGASGEPSLDLAADAVASILASAGVTRAVVAGLSMGGYVALALAERHPTLVAGLGLLDTKSTVDDPAAHANRLRTALAVESSGSVDAVRPMVGAVLGATSAQTRPELARRLAAMIDDQSPAGVAWSQRAMAGRPDRTAVLTRFAGPALVLVGAEDLVTPLAAAEHMRAALADAALVVVPQSGHMSAVEQPEAVASALEALARRVDAASAGTVETS